jgi:hypothetical protein
VQYARLAGKWYREAATKNAACGETGLGFLYWYGYGVDASYDEAITWTERAAEHGDEQAVKNLGIMRAGWELAPLFAGNWQQVIGPARRQEIDRLRAAGALSRIGTQDVRRMRQVALDFYDGAPLYELEVGRADGTRAILTYIRMGERLVYIDGKSPQIHELSRSVPVRLDTWQRASAFLRFFTGAIQSEHGRFRIVDTGNDLTWLSSAPAYQRANTGALVQSLFVLPNGSGGWNATAYTQYGTTLFKTLMTVKPGGMVEMVSDEPVADNLPIAPERFDANGLRFAATTTAS